MHSPPFFSSTRSESRWVNHISTNYKKNLSFDPCVFQVPQSLRDENPQAYTPQAVGLGPFHHLRPDIQEMENLKRTLVKDFLHVADFKKFIKFVDEAADKLEPKNGQENFLSTVLPHYDRFVDLESSTLVWILAIDGIFLMQFLKGDLGWKDHRMVADIMMLENQIPLLLLEKLGKALEEEDSFPGVAEVQLFSQFRCFCREQSPLKICDDSVRQEEAFDDANHLLDFLYLMIVENNKPRQESGDECPNPRSSQSRLELLKQAFPRLGHFIVETAQDIASAIKEAKSQGLRVPQCFDNVSKILEQLQKTSDLHDKRDEDVQPQHRLANKIDVPSVSQLRQLAGINCACCARDGGIRNIFFDDGENTLYLPKITLSETSEVVLRNLVAHEAASKPVGSVLELAEYVDLMCGIIRSENDVKLLKESGIIIQRGNLLDEEIVRIFNGINKSMQIPDEVSEIQRTVQKLSNSFRQQEETSENKPIEVPSVSKLCKAEIKIDCKDGGISFDPHAATLNLIEIKLPESKLADATQDKTLDAYEAEYVEFMRTIIKDADDVDLLKKSKIIKGNLSGEEIFGIFKRYKSIRMRGDRSEIIQRIKQKLSNQFQQSICKLRAAEIEIAYTNCSDISYSKRKATLCLREIDLGNTRDVALGKLGAYDPDIELGHIRKVALEELGAYKAEYVDFMCSIIKGAADVCLLKKSKIIKGKLPDEEISRIFNEINISNQILPDEQPTFLLDEQSKIQRIKQRLSILRIKQKLSNLSMIPADKQSQIQRTKQKLLEHGLANEIEVPSVSKLDKADIKFACPDGESKRNILFEQKKNTTLYLPEIELGDTHEDALKRLGAYEAGYVDFLCSIIKDVNDVNLLKKSHIIKGSLPDDEILDVFDDFNEKRRDIEWPKELTLVQETVHKLNTEFRNLRMVKAYKSFKNFFEGFQRWVKRLFPTFVLLLLILQSAFEIHGWVRESRRSGYGAVSRASSSFGLEDSEPKLILPRKVLGYDRNLM